MGRFGAFGGGVGLGVLGLVYWAWCVGVLGLERQTRVKKHRNRSAEHQKKKTCGYKSVQGAVRRHDSRTSLVVSQTARRHQSSRADAKSP